MSRLQHRRARARADPARRRSVRRQHDGVALAGPEYAFLPQPARQLELRLGRVRAEARLEHTADALRDAGSRARLRAQQRAHESRQPARSASTRAPHRLEALALDPVKRLSVSPSVGSRYGGAPGEQLVEHDAEPEQVARARRRRSPSSCSGAMYGGEPIVVPGRVSPSLVASIAMPKSAIFTSPLRRAARSPASSRGAPCRARGSPRAACELERHQRGNAPREALSQREGRAQVDAVDVLLGDVVLAAPGDPVVDGHDVLVVDRRRRTRFAREALDQVLARGELRPQPA